MVKTELRPEWAYPEALRRVINIMSLDKNTEVVGSYKYKVHKYPADCDLNSYYVVTLPKHQASAYYANRLTAIYKTLLADDLIITDFKAGWDQRYRNIKTPADLTSNLFKPSEIKVLTKLYQQDAIAFEAEIKEYYTIRWQEADVLNGYKVKNGKSWTLAESLITGGSIKIDTVVWALDRYIGVECLYDLNYEQQGEIIPLYDLPDYLTVLIDDLYKYSKPTSYNPLKVLKRFWSIARYLDCDRLFQQISPILGTHLVGISQIISDINVLIQIMPVLDEKQWELAFLELLNFENRINSHLDAHSYVELTFAWPAYQSWLEEGKVDVKKLEVELENIVNTLKPPLIELSEKYYDIINNSPTIC